MHVIRKRPQAEAAQTKKISYNDLTPSARLELDSRPMRRDHNQVVDLRKQSALRDLEALFSGPEDRIRNAS